MLVSENKISDLSPVLFLILNIYTCISIQNAIYLMTKLLEHHDGIYFLISQHPVPGERSTKSLPFHVEGLTFCGNLP